MSQLVSPILEVGDFRKMLPGVRDVRTFITDPPYNLGFNYGPVDDKKPWPVYRRMMRDMAKATFKAAAPDANLFIIHYPESIAQLWGDLVGDWSFKQWLTWCYPTNLCGGTHVPKWPRGSRAVLWLTKGNPPFNLKATVQPYRNPGDKRVKANVANGSQGAPLYDWWEIDQVKGGSDEHMGYSNQIPQELLKRLILATTEPGDMVADPFAGTGSTAKAASLLGRIGYGCDANPQVARHWGLASPGCADTKHGAQTGPALGSHSQGNPPQDGELVAALQPCGILDGAA